MQVPSLPLTKIFALAVASALAACAANAGNHFTTATSAAGGAGGSGASAGSGASTGAGLGGTNFATVGSGATTGSGGENATYAYAHTNDTLYQFDPAVSPIAMKEVGKFDCIDANGANGLATSMTDVAVNGTGDLWGVSSKNAYHLEIMGGAVHCVTPFVTLPAGATFYGLSFAPANVIDASETLVAGNTAGQIWKIDITGNTPPEQHGTLGVVHANDGQGHTYPLDEAVTGNTVGKAWELSGDIVFLSNGDSPVGFATVRDCKSPPSSANCDATDTLLEIDMGKLKAAGAQDVSLAVRGAVVKASGCADAASGYGSMYGIAAWGSKIYGFSHQGAIVEISNVDGSACAVPGTSAQWDGAGVTTSAQITPPPPPPH